MDETQHRALENTLSAYRSHCLSTISHTFSTYHEDLTASEAFISSDFLARFSRVEDLLTGPYDRRLDWEWVEESCPSRVISQALVQRRIRLRDLPEFEVCAKDYFVKFANTGERILEGLEQIGFHLPPCSKLFEHFLLDVVEGKRLVVAKADLRPVYIPDDQVDLAYAKAQKMISNDADLQKFLPRGIPETIPDKLYFLEIVNTLRGLEYKAVLPITNEEKRTVEDIRKTMNGALSQLGRVDRSDGGVGELNQTLVRLRQSDYGVSDYLDMYAKYHSRLAELEAREMSDEED